MALSEAEELELLTLEREKAALNAHDSSEYEPPKSRQERKREALLPNAGKSIAAGVGETALAAGTGIGATIAGGLRGIADIATGGTLESAAEKSKETQEKYTYQPRTEAGQALSKAVATPMELAKKGSGAVGGMIGKSLGDEALGQTIGEAAPEVALTAIPGAAALKSVRGLGATTGTQAASLASGLIDSLAAPVNTLKSALNAPTMPKEIFESSNIPPQSVGAAGMTPQNARLSNAAQLEGAPPLMKFQQTKSPVETTIAKEAAKRPGGEPIMQRLEAQQEFIPEYLDRLIDKTNAQLPLDPYAFGGAVNEAVGKLVKKLKSGIRAAYEKAEASPEADTIVTPTKLESYFNELEQKGVLEATAKRAPIIGTIRKAFDAAKKSQPEEGPSILSAEGTPIKPTTPVGITVRQAEELRKLINRFTDVEGDAVDFQQGTVLKRAIDSDLENAGGKLYQDARRLRKEFGERFEDYKNLSDLITMKGAEHKIPLAQVFDKLVLGGNRDSILHLRKVLREADPEIWKEVQGQTINYILKEATRSNLPMQSGKYAPSPAKLRTAIQKLELDGKLDQVLGKGLADEVRALQKYSEDTLVDAANNFINRSNTAVIKELDRKGFFGSIAGAAEKITRPIKGVHALAEHAAKMSEKSNIGRIAKEQLSE